MGLMPEPSRETVMTSLIRSFPYDWPRIIKEMKWNSIEENWTIIYCGMLVGIEPDGYVHS